MPQDNPATAMVPRAPRSININQLMWRVMRMGDVTRGLMARWTGGSFGGKRDLYSVFGWDQTIDSGMMWQMFTRGGIARTIVTAYGDATWGSPPEVTATKKWSTAWETLVNDHKIWSVLHRLDRLSNLGQYAVLVVGTDDTAKMDQPVNTGRENKVLYLQPFSDRSAVITAWGTDPKNERFGLPIEYTINPGMAMAEGRITGGKGIQGPSRGSYKVHWSRVIHIAQGAMENEIFGVPLLWAVWNYLTDLMKVTGGSAESYWLTANRGMHANVEKDMDLDPDDEAALSEEIEEYQNGQRRFIRTRGVEVTSLGSDVANPEGPFRTLIALIAGTTRIPMRILLGSESAHNASTQDKGNWAEHVEEYRTLQAMPYFLGALVTGFMRMGVIQAIPLDKVKVEWPSAYRLSPLEQGQMDNQRATAANNLGLALKNVKNLMGRQEARKFVGLPEDNKGDELEIADGGSTDQNGTGSSADGGAPKTGPGSGNTATSGSDSNGSGDATQGRKATNT